MNRAGVITAQYYMFKSWEVPLKTMSEDYHTVLIVT